MGKSEHGWVPTDKAVARGGQRIVHLVHFVSGNVVPCFDDGCDERGAPNQQRQHLMNVLKKRIRFGGNEYPTFRLAKEPGAWSEPRNDKEKANRARDSFDRDVLRDDSNQWRTPSAAWLAASEQCRAAEAARNNELKQKAKSERAQKGLEVLEKLAAAVMAGGEDEEGAAKKKKGSAAA